MRLMGQDGHVDRGLLLLRIGIGIMFIFHGAPKMLGGPDKWAIVGKAMSNFGIDFFHVFWGFLAACSEFGGGIFLIGGFLTRPACVLMTLTMIVAAVSHFSRGQGLGGASHAIEAGILFVSLFLMGPGKYSLDRVISERLKR